MQPATATTKNGTPAAGASRLGTIKRGKLNAALRCVFYGPEGVGKSTLAANAPDPVWLDIEDGSGRLDVARYRFRDGDGGHVPQSFSEVLSAVEDLTRNPHSFKTVVVDTVDRLESLIWRHMIERDATKVKGGIETIEDYGYGKGYQIAVDEWRAFCGRLDTLRATRNMTVILLAHAHVRPFKNPDGDDFDRYTLQVNDKASGFLKGWADVLGFCRFDEGATKQKGSSRAKGWSTGRRLLSLERTAGADGKGRGGMPAELELELANPWAPFAKAIQDSESLDASALVTLITEECARIADAELTIKVADAIAAPAKNNDTETLNRYLQELKRRDRKEVA